MTNEQLTQKLKRQFRTTLLLMLVSFVVLVGTTLAWFANNKIVDAGGMVTKVEVTPNLVIALSKGTASGGIAYSKLLENSPFSVSLSSSDAYVLAPATYMYRSSSVGNSNLGYIADKSKVSATTGATTSAVSLTEVPVYQNTDKHRYYVDYTVYVASSGTTMSACTISAVFTTTGSVQLATDSGLRAASIDIYVRTPNADDTSANTFYQGTVNLSDNGSVDIYYGDVPQNTYGCMTIVLRCYMDGALKIPGDSRTFIRSNNIDVSNLTTKISFIATTAD